MELTLSDDDARTLGAFLHDHFRDLQLEIARTDVKAFRQGLLRRREAIERVLEQIDRGAGDRSGREIDRVA